MKGLNKCYLIGRVGRDIELLDTDTGVYCKVNLATTSARKVDDEWVDKTEWFRLTAHGKEALFLAENAGKGDSLAVECSLLNHEWVDSSGVQHRDLTLRVDRVLWLHKRNAKEAQDATAKEEG